MKVIVTGATGLIGSEVLTQLLASSSVTSVIAITRRELPDSISKNDKLQTLVHGDFGTWPQETLSQLSGADACIWSLGIAMGNLETQRKVNLDYTLNAAKAFAHSLAPEKHKKDGGKFRFLYTSGMLAERDQGKTLWFIGDARKIRGQVENRLLSLAEDSNHKENFSVCVVRPGFVGGRGGSIITNTVGLFTNSLGIAVDQLAATMTDLAINNAADTKAIWDNPEMLQRAQVLSKARA